METGIGQRPKPKKFDRIARIPWKLFRDAERAARHRGMKTAAYIESILRGPVEADAAAAFVEHLDRIGWRGKTPPDPPGDIRQWPRPRAAVPGRVRSELLWDDLGDDGPTGPGPTGLA